MNLPSRLWELEHSRQSYEPGAILSSILVFGSVFIPVLALKALPLAFAPSCLGREKTPEGGLHAEVGPKPKLSSRSSATKEEEGNSLGAPSGAVD